MTLVLAALLAIATLPPPPVAAQAPAVSARAWVLVDSGREVVLAGKDPHARLAVASLTKIMTAVVALREGVLTDDYTVDSRDLPGEASIGLKPGDRVPLEALLYGLLMRSGNDAAAVIARGIGDRVAARRGVAVDGAALFTTLMNDEAAALGMVNTQFRNPHGLDAPDHVSSAYDMALLVRHALRDPTFRRMFGATSYSYRGTQWTNVNRLLTQYDGLVGGKTGVEDEAGLCLVEVAQRDGRQLIVVVLNAPRWYDDARALLDAGFAGSVALSPLGLTPFGAPGAVSGPAFARLQLTVPPAAVVTATTTSARGLPPATLTGAPPVSPMATPGVLERARGAADDAISAGATVAAPAPAEPMADLVQFVIAVAALLAAVGVGLFLLSFLGIGPLANRSRRAGRRPGARHWQTYQVGDDQPRPAGARARAEADGDEAQDDDAPRTRAPAPIDPSDTPATPTGTAAVDDAVSSGTEQARLLQEHVTLAVRHAQAGRQDTAESFFVKAIQIAPDARMSTLPDFWNMPPEGFVALALAYRRCSRLPQARAVVGLAILAYPDHADLKALDRRLQAERRT